MNEPDDIKFMRQAFELSKKGFGFVNPNPIVGAVIVKNGKVLGEGYHEFFGGPHAEINALKNVVNAQGATLYVTLEPCNHFGKTPPCTERIIMEKFSRIVIGIKDPNPLVNGKGIKKLIGDGVNVESGILNDEIQRLNEVYIKYITTGLPYCVLKTAMTLDGKISTFKGDSKWISNEKSRDFVHELRHRYAAIMVGVNTIIKDNPDLTDRSNNLNKKHPLRIIVDSNGRTPAHSSVWDQSVAPTLFATTKNANKDFIEMVKKKDCEAIICPEKDKKVNLSFLIANLGKRNIDSILLEGGSTLNFSAIQEGIIDKVYSFISPKMLGGEKANTPLGGAGFSHVDQAITLNIHEIIRMDEDLMIESYIIKN
jgi:diaminohydroxyphosphoribosylaminopyrimidine deaminase / 5-amino-6-(5-phosphoribosylamino)uracil reductase